VNRILGDPYSYKQASVGEVHKETYSLRGGRWSQDARCGLSSPTIKEEGLSEPCRGKKTEMELLGGSGYLRGEKSVERKGLRGRRKGCRPLDYLGGEEQYHTGQKDQLETEEWYTLVRNLRHTKEKVLNTRDLLLFAKGLTIG